MTTIPVEEFEDDTFGNPLTRRSTWMDRLEAWGFGQTTEAGLLMDDEEYEEAVGGGQEQEGFGLGGDGDGDDENDEIDEQYEVDGVIDNRNGDSLLSKQGVGHYGDDGGGGAFQQQAKMHSQGSIRTSESFQGTSVVFGTGGGGGFGGFGGGGLAGGFGGGLATAGAGVGAGGGGAAARLERVQHVPPVPVPHAPTAGTPRAGHGAALHPGGQHAAVRGQHLLLLLLRLRGGALEGLPGPRHLAGLSGARGALRPRKGPQFRLRGDRLRLPGKIFHFRTLRLLCTCFIVQYFILMPFINNASYCNASYWKRNI